MTRTALGSLLATAALVLSACGDDGGTTVVSTTTVTDSSASTAPLDPDAQPEGVMTADGIGQVSEGSTEDEVIAAFGEPDAAEELPGCELNPDAAPLRQLTYELDEGSLAVNLNADTGEMSSFFTDSPSLETERGDRVGDSWQSLVNHWGAALDPIVLGTEKPTSGEGPYKVGLDGENQLIFDLQDDTIQRISGGYLPPCE